MIDQNTEPNIIHTRSVSKARQSRSRVQVKREPGTHTYTHTQSDRKTRSAYKATSTPVKKFERESKRTPFSCAKHTPRSARPAQRDTHTHSLSQSRSVPRSLGLTLVYEADEQQAISLYDDSNTTRPLAVCSSPRRRLFSEEEHTLTVSETVGGTMSETVAVTAVSIASTTTGDYETVTERESAVWSLSALLREFFDAVH